MQGLELTMTTGTGTLRSTVVGHAAWLLAVCAFSFPARGGEAADSSPDGGRAFVSEHSGSFNGTEVRYRSTFGETVIRNEEGEDIASIFATSYVRTGVAAADDRPVVFLWNGGPSAASQTLHMAGLGPKRLVVPEDVSAPIEPPYRVVDNVRTVLDAADLVFVDPVETGFSRVLEAGDRAWFYSVDGDAESIAAFIQEWLVANGRAHSPKYVLGTSYGSVRAALVAGALAESPMPLDGAILFSQGVNLVETTQRQNNIVGYASNMSQQAAIAWYHGRTAHQDKDVFEVIELAERFAMDEYLVALAKGRRLPEAERETVAGVLSELTGIGTGYWLAHGLRIKKPRFRRELLRDEGRVLAAADARYSAPADAEEGPASPTSGVADVHREHMAAFLGVGLPLDEYRGFAPDSFAKWGWGGTSTLDGSKAPPGALRTVFADFDYPGALLPAFAANEGFRILIATGIYDTLTTVGPARLLASHVDYPGERVAIGEYRGGHAFYSNDEDFERLTDDLRAFLSQREPGKAP